MGLYEDLLNKNNKSNEELNQLKDLMGYVSLSPEDEAERQARIDAVNPNGTLTAAFKDAGFNGEAVRQDIAWTVYLLSKKGMSFREAIDFRTTSPGFTETMAEFHEFVKSHPVRGQNVDIEKNVGDWTEMFMNAAEKIGEYTIPDIDYTNPEELRQHVYELEALRMIQINFSQEFSNVIAGPRRAFAEKKAGGSKKLDEVISIPINAQGFLTGYIDAYNPVNLVSYLNNKVQKDALDFLATRRITFLNTHAKNVGGKKVKDLGKTQAIDPLYGNLPEMIQPDFQFKKNEARDYFKNNSLSPERNAEFLASINRRQESLRRTYNKMFAFDPVYKLYRDTPSDIEKISNELEELGNHIDQPEELVRALYTNEHEKTRNILKNVFFSSLQSDTRPTLWEMIGKDNPINIFRIGGKTPEELWGEKAANLPPADKNMYYQVRLLQEMKNGRQDITCDMYLINDQYKLNAPKPVLIAQSEKNIYAEASVFKQVDRLHVHLNEILEQLDATGETGKSKYMAMRNSLKKCVQLTDFTAPNSKSNMKQIMDSLKELEEKSDAYYKDHTGLKGLYKGFGDEGRERIRISKDLRYDLQFEREKLRNYTGGYDFYVDKDLVDPDTEFREFSLNKMWKNLKASAGMRGIQLTDQVLKTNHPEIDQRCAKMDKKDNMMRILHTVAIGGKVSAEENRLEAMESPIGPNAVKMAQRVVFQEYQSKIRTAGKTAADLSVEEIEKDIRDQGFSDRFHEKVRTLLKDPAFMKLAHEKPKTVIQEWKKLKKQESAARHQNLQEQDETYKELRRLYPKNFEKRWDMAEERIRIWGRDWEKSDYPREVRQLKEEILPQLSTRSLQTNQSEEAHRALVEAASDRLAHTLAQAILKDYYKNNNHHQLMMVACAPHSPREMEKYISDGLKNTKVFETKATATALFRDFNSLKQKAVQFITDGEARKLNQNANHNLNQNANLNGPADHAGQGNAQKVVPPKAPVI